MAAWRSVKKASSSALTLFEAMVTTATPSICSMLQWATRAFRDSSGNGADRLDDDGRARHVLVGRLRGGRHGGDLLHHVLAAHDLAEDGVAEALHRLVAVI